jgi:glyoxylase-like metal-dependent hydrolase (beta-lactamase superfamily II)
MFYSDHSLHPSSAFQSFGKRTNSLNKLITQADSMMKKFLHTTLVCAILATSNSHAQSIKEVLDSAAKALSSTEVSSLKMVGSGSAYSFGQAVRAEFPWPVFVEANDYTVSINFKNASIKTEFDRTPLGGNAATSKPVRVSFLGTPSASWNVIGVNASPAVTAIEQRQLELWATPFGLIQAARLAGNASKLDIDKKTGARILSFPIGATKVKATLLANNLIDKVEYLSDTDMLGDTRNIVSFANYRNFDGIQYPSHIVRHRGDFPVLDLRINSVTANADINIEVPKDIAEKMTVSQEPIVTVEALAPGVFFIAGQSHHSTAVEFKDHIVIFDAPQNDARVLAVFAAAKKAIPNKPIRYVVVSHNHFDHAGGLRAAVAEGATIITHSSNLAFFKDVIAAPHSIRPDHLTKKPSKANFKTMDDLLVLADDSRRLELHRLAGHPHNDGMLVAYLPNEKILCEVDAFSLPVLAPNAPASPIPPADINTRNLYENMQRLTMQVERIAPGHGRLSSIKDLLAALAQAQAK